MITVLSVRFRKSIAWFLYVVLYTQTVVAAEEWKHAVSPYYPPLAMGTAHGDMQARPEKPDLAPTIQDLTAEVRKRPSMDAAAPAFGGGPTQPEMQSFQSVNANNMVDLFSGDFSYNIPLLDVGGYPVNISYRSGISMDEDASWVGLGWNINPGSITRNMRGLPDDFNGGNDTVRKVAHIKDNTTFGVTAGLDAESTGWPLLTYGASLGVFHSTYNGWGLELAGNASLNAGKNSHGPLAGGLSFADNSQNGITISPSLTYKLGSEAAGKDEPGFGMGIKLGLPFNSRTGIKALQLGLNNRQSTAAGKVVRSSTWNTEISFAGPSYTPTMNLATTNYNFSFTAKFGLEIGTHHPNAYISGYGGKEYIAGGDTSLSLPAFGYLNYQNINGNWSALTDFNREKELPYREKPAIPHIAVPAYTYDLFTIAGEGTGGMFRAYRGDIGFVADHQMQSKTTTGALSVDLGAGNAVHGGTDLNVNFSTTRTGPWIPNNLLRNNIGFHKSDKLFESSYFRNPGEKTINTTTFYDSVGGDDVVTPVLFQSGTSDPNIMTTNRLYKYDKGKQDGFVTMDSTRTRKVTRDKRSEVISYLTASEAAQSGLDKHIVHYAVNKFGLQCCSVSVPEDTMGKGTGLLGYYYGNMGFKGAPINLPRINGQPTPMPRLDRIVYFDWVDGSPFWYGGGGGGHELDNTIMRSDRFAIRWVGRIKPPTTGCYNFGIKSDDGVRLWINDSLIIDDWTIHSQKWNTAKVSMVGGKMYNIRLEYFEWTGPAACFLCWKKPGDMSTSFTPQGDSVAGQYLYTPDFTDTVELDTIRTQEERVNEFRRGNHISEIDVLNPDGRRYVYGIPVYNLKQKEVSFSADAGLANMQTGLTEYVEGRDNTIKNDNGKDGYFSKQEMPAYAHSFLLTGLLSPDYVDVTGDGISDDDIGDAVKFNYSKTAGIVNPYEWRAPYATGVANYDEGFRSYSRDDKGHYIYGSKELWYLHSIESKTMVANFVLQQRADLLEADEHGSKLSNGKAMCLKQIDLYSKVDYMQHGDAARPIKTVHFEYAYELCRGINSPVNDSGKLTLKRIWFTYNGNEKGVKNPYVFHYHSNNPNYKVNSADKWGTYKDASQNPGATSSNFITNGEYPYALQDSATAADNAGAWTLDSIGLPSGGKIRVKYESDDYAFVQNRRATLMCNIAGIGRDTLGHFDNRLYGGGLGDKLFVYVKVPYAVSNNSDLWARYLEGINKFYFRLNVRMPTDDFGSGYEYVPTYAQPDVAYGHWYGVLNDSTIWIRIKGVNSAGSGDGSLSPLAQTAINFLRLNLPSKAYPGSELRDDLNFVDIIKSCVAIAGNIVQLLNGFSNSARSSGWVNNLDLSRSFIRLDAPTMKKYGGGLRVKSVLIYDNWKKMTGGVSGKKETVYGQTYSYTTTRLVNGAPVTISSGVATWEPTIGGEENPFHLPIEYVDQVAPLAPAAGQYTEEPLGETFFPSPSIGYNKVRVRTIHAAKTRSANGFSETSFYTSYDFPTTWDWSLLDNDTKKRYKPLLQNFLRINAVNYLTMSQGFKVELNDMNGKLRSEATYAETDSVHPISYTENFYKVDNQSVQFKHLDNQVMTVDPLGNINAKATIGKDVELMADMREQTSTSIGANINVNVDFFLAGVWPVVIPSLLSLYQKETNQFRSAAMMKVIQRYGILDSVVHIDKGSMVSSKNLLFDSETGDPILVRTGNEFDDSLYQFTYPAHWAYQAAGPAYQNIGALLQRVKLVNGEVLNLSDTVSKYLSPGDELLVYSKESMPNGCDSPYAHFPDAYRLWVIDTSMVHGGTQALRLVDKRGIPFSGNDVTIKVVRSGHRNLGSAVGSVSSLYNPLKADGSGVYHLVIDSTIGVLNSSAMEMQQYWKVADKRTSDISTSCVYTAQDSAEMAAEGCSCLKPFFDYLISHHLLFIKRRNNITVGTLVQQAAAAGYPVSLGGCPLLNANASKLFYTTNTSSSPVFFWYGAMIGNVRVDLLPRKSALLDFYNLASTGCDANGRVTYKIPGAVAPKPDTITTKIYASSSANLFSLMGSDCPGNTDHLTSVDTTADHMMVENSLLVNGYERNAISVLQFDRLGNQLPFWARILSAKMVLQADHRGHIPGTYNDANSQHPNDSTGYSMAAPDAWFYHQDLDTLLYQAYYSDWFRAMSNKTAYQDDTIDMKDYLTNVVNGTYPSSTFILTQGSGKIHNPVYDTSLIGSYVPPDLVGDSSYIPTPVRQHLVPPYLMSGYSNYYSTFYSPRYADTSKRPAIKVTYTYPVPAYDSIVAYLQFNSTISCTSVTSRSCYSSITDTLVNPYQYGVLGNLRAQKSYVYYGRRKESDPTQPTNIRINGTINSFLPFWQLQSGKWQPAYDTTRWVWNSQTNLYNRKGFELENADPLGRYNAGLFGYGLTLPTATVQNGRYQEVAFEGFEDYGFTTNTCDTLCPETRPFDFSMYKGAISDSMAHTGLYSLRVEKNASVAIAVPVSSTPAGAVPDLTMTNTGGHFAGARAGSPTVLPSFNPLAGKKMLVSAWVKEKNVCTCKSYTRDHILVSFSGGSSVTLQPSGNMIEGWQRVEAVVIIPTGTTGMTVSLQASDSSTTYFDDIRVLPYNGEMKSYVYNPINLRLMAELDENNYATFYEYDDDGTLVRVKKETERGIMTIKETHSALLKNQ